MQIQNFNTAHELNDILAQVAQGGQRIRLLDQNSVAIYEKPTSVFGKLANWVREVSGANRRDHEQVVNTLKRLVDQVNITPPVPPKPQLRERAPSIAQPNTGEQSRGALATPQAVPGPQATEPPKPPEVPKTPEAQTPKATPQATPTPTPVSTNRTDSKEENPALYAKDPPFGAGGIVKGHYVQRQYGDCCLAHALASYQQAPVFKTRQEFLDFRNVSYNDWDDSAIELSEVTCVKAVANRLNAQQVRENNRGSTAPWVARALDVETPPGPITPAFNQQTKKQIDDALNHFAQVSDSKRFIVRNGAQSGHFQTLVYEPGKNPEGPWTILNSTKNIDTGLPDVKSGQSPAELLGALGVRNAQIFVWTQANDPAAVAHGKWVVFGDLEQAAPKTPAPAEIDDNDDDLPPPIFTGRGQTPAANTPQEVINPTPTPVITPAANAPKEEAAFATALTPEELARQLANEAHKKLAIKAFSHRVAEAVLIDPFFVKSVAKNVEKFNFLDYLAGTETYPNPENTPHVLRLAEKIRPYEYYLAGRLQAIGLIQNKEDIWGVTNEDIIAWYDRSKNKLDIPLEIPELPIETPRPAPAATPVQSKPVEPKPQETPLSPAAQAFANIFGKQVPPTKEPAEIIALVKKSDFFGKISKEEGERQIRLIRNELSKSGSQNTLAGLEYIQKLKQKIDDGLYVENQSDLYCGKHAMAAFFGRAVFPTEESFLKAKREYILNSPDIPQDPTFIQLMLEDIEPRTEGYMLEIMMKQYMQKNPELLPAEMRGKTVFSHFIPGRRRVNRAIDNSAQETDRMKVRGKELLKALNESPNNAFIIGDSNHWYTIKRHNGQWRVLNSYSPNSQPLLDVDRLLETVAGTNLNIYGLADPTGQWKLENYLRDNR